MNSAVTFHVCALQFCTDDNSTLYLFLPNPSFTNTVPFALLFIMERAQFIPCHFHDIN